MAGKTNRKHRRNKEYCDRYKIENRQSINKLIKAKRHSAEHPNDKQKAAEVPNYARKKPQKNIL
jgi:hypothetical protein